MLIEFKVIIEVDADELSTGDKIEFGEILNEMEEGAAKKGYDIYDQNWEVIE